MAVLLVNLRRQLQKRETSISRKSILMCRMEEANILDSGNWAVKSSTDRKKGYICVDRL